MTAYLPDSRPYPTVPVKNELLRLAARIAYPVSEDDAAQARAGLNLQIEMMLSQNHYLMLSVAMSMAPDAPVYTALMNAIDDVLCAQSEDEVQWFALPVIIVAGSNEHAELKTAAPAAELSACLANYPNLRPLEHATWLPKLIRADDFAQITPERWFTAKRNTEAAQKFADSLPEKALAVPKDQSVHTLYAVGYGDAKIQAALGLNLREAALPLMQVWQEHLAEKGLTLFTNPLTPNTPLAALADANHMRLRMALDVFTANSVRAIRLQSPRVGVVMAAQEGGKLLFGFNAAESVYEILPQIFTWQLSPRENIATVQQNFLDLLTDCQVENIHLLHDVLNESDKLPNYAHAVNMPGHNPLFSTPTEH